MHARMVPSVVIAELKADLDRLRTVAVAISRKRSRPCRPALRLDDRGLVPAFKRRMSAIARVKATGESVRTGERGPETQVYEVVGYV